MRAPRHRIPIAALLLAPLAACSPDTDRDRRSADVPLARGEVVTPTVATVDGVRTMTHDAAAFDRAPRLELDPTPIAVLGAPDDDPAYDLTRVDEVALLSDGRAATRSDIGARVLVFGRDGRGERVVGRAGQGPGEFARAQSLVQLPGDTLLVLDTQNGRLNRIHPASGAVHAAPITTPASLSFPHPLPHPLPDGRLVFYVGAQRRPGELGATFRAPASIILLATDGSAPLTVATLPGWEYVTIETRYRGRRHPDTPPLRLGRRSHAAVVDSSIVTAVGNDYEMEYRALDGTVRARLRVAVPRRAVTAAMRDSVVARELAAIADRVGEGNRDVTEERRLAREAPFADSLPPYSALLTSRDGTLWVVDAIAPTDTAWTATAFRRDGAIVGRLQASGRGRPMAFESDRVAVRHEDADGIVTVRVHRIRPAPR